MTDIKSTLADIDVQATKHAPIYQLLYQLLAIIIAYHDNHETFQ